MRGQMFDRELNNLRKVTSHFFKKVCTELEENHEKKTFLEF